MAGWILVPCLVSLRAEFTRIAPNRDTASDGSIGDARHRAESSDHNADDTPGSRTPYTDSDNIPEVHAIDVDNDLKRPPITFDQCIQTIVTRHRAGQDDRLQNVIWNRRIWSRSWGWTARAYTGASQHTEHGHFSARYGSGSGPGNPENDTRPWGLLDLIEGDDVELTDLIGDKGNPRRTVGDVFRDLAKLRGYQVGDPVDTKNAVILPGSPIGKLMGIPGQLDTLGKALLAAIAANQGVDVDEDAIAAGVVAGLTPEKIAAWIPAGIAQEVVDLLAARMQA